MSNFAILFPGQGSQYVGMGKKWYDSSEKANRLFVQAEEILNIPLRELCFEGDLHRLTQTYHAQPAILTVSYISYRLFLDQYGMSPLYMMGHSLGEITALTCAGVYTFEEALLIVQKRGQLMHEAALNQEGSMVSIQRLPLYLVKEICASVSGNAGEAVVSNDNSSQQIVISGHRQAVTKAAARMEKLGAVAIPLNVSAPFHSPLMKPAEEQFRHYLAQFKPAPFQTTVISNLDALPYRDEREVEDKLAKQLTHPVKWQDCMSYVKNAGIEWMVETAPKSVLKNLSSGAGNSIFAMDQEEDINRLSVFASGVSRLDTKNFIKGCLAQAVCTRNHNLNPAQYETGVLQQVRTLESMLEQLETEQREPLKDEIAASLKALFLIFKTKQVPEVEQQSRLAKLMNMTLPISLIEWVRSIITDWNLSKHMV